MASHLDGILSDHGKALPADVAAVLLEDLSRIEKELGWLSDDIEFLTPHPNKGAGHARSGGEKH